jgi:glycosyltransferase involved in cell wall biosynthesis
MSDAMPYPSMRYADMTAAEVASFCQAFGDQLGQVIASFRPDLIHLHHLWVLSSLAARFDRLPVVTMHGTELKQLVAAPQHRCLAEVGARRIAHFFSVSRDVARESVCAFGLSPTNVTVVGNGFNASVFYPPTYITEESPIVLCAGKFVDWKGFKFAIRASGQVEIDHRLVILGTGPSEEQAQLQREVSAMGLDDRVQFRGHVAQEEVADWMRVASLFVLPSLNEPFGLVLLEAMACGCPVLAAARGGPLDLITSEMQGAGLATLIAPLDPGKPDAPARYVTDLASAISRHLMSERSLPQRRALAERVRGMTWGRVYREQRKVYERILGG